MSIRWRRSRITSESWDCRLRPFTSYDRSPGTTVHQVRPFTRYDRSPGTTVHQVRPFTRYDRSPGTTVHQVRPCDLCASDQQALRKRPTRITVHTMLCCAM